MAKRRRFKHPRALGAASQFIGERLHLTNAEIFEQARAAGFHIKKIEHVAKRRRMFERRAAKWGNDANPAPLNGAHHSSDASASNGASMHPKEAQLRRLIFELGFDVARRVFHEFESLHQTMRG